MPHPLLNRVLEKKEYCSINLSASNPSLDFTKTSNPKYLGIYIDEELNKNDVNFGVGGYAEKRAIYNASDYFSTNGKQRCIHLGIDIWTEAYTTFYSPLDAIVHSFKNNSLPYDYGGTIILQHEWEGKKIHTLYGHLSLDSLKGLKKGMEFKAGQAICQIGDWHENGGWPPHLHFQIINDMEGMEGDYFGASTENEKSYYLNNCPNPSFLLGIKS